MQDGRALELRAAAAKARRLAKATTDPITIDELIAFAEEREAEADRLEQAGE